MLRGIASQSRLNEVGRQVTSYIRCDKPIQIPRRVIHVQALIYEGYQHAVGSLVDNALESQDLEPKENIKSTRLRAKCRRLDQQRVRSCRLVGVRAMVDPALHSRSEISARLTLVCKRIRGGRSSGGSLYYQMLVCMHPKVWVLQETVDKR